MVGSEKRIKTVCHLGPSESKGGMASIIHLLSSNTPDGWKSNIISTRGRSIFSIVPKWISARSKLKSEISSGRVQIAHIHVTHSLSWWRKRDLMGICQKGGVPTIIHIHSGKFDEFCSGIGGKSVKKELAKENRRTKENCRNRR